jgi:hypothetical protein
MMRRTPRFAAAAVLLGTVGLAATLGVGSSAAFADDEDGIGLSVTVSPAPSDTTAPGTAPASGGSGSSGSTGGSGGSGGSGSSNSSGGSSTPVDAVAPVTDTPAPEDDEVDLGGVLFVSGLTSAYDWSIDPLGGATEASFTVRNVSTSTFSSTVRFWADGPVGNRLSEVEGVRISALKPGESRTVDARLTGIGQSTFVRLHATLAPPTSVDGVKLESVTRDQFVVVAPWALLAIAGLGGLGFAAYALVQHGRRPLAPAGLVGAPA